jgi:hypothetical protein
MTTSLKRRRLGGIANLFARPGSRKHNADATAAAELRPEEALPFYLSRDNARKALSLLLDNIRKENPGHHDRIVSDLENGHWSPLAGYVLQMAFFESIRSPVRPLALPSKVGDWLLALPDNRAGYHPEDPCWECGYAYPFSWDPGTSPGSVPGSASPACRSILPASFSAMHPWVGQRCLYCGGEIVNHLEWLSPNPKRTLSDFQNAPYRKKR